MLEPTYSSAYVEAKRSAEVSAAPGEVKEAATEWALDVGWEFVAAGDAFLLFRIGNSLVWGGIDMEVSAARSGGSTRVLFLARARRLYPSMSAEMERAAEAFANGVLRELTHRGATVNPSRLATARQDRQRLKARKAFRRRLHWVLLAVLVPVPVVVGILSHNPFFGLATFLWLMGAIMTGQIERLRAIGMGASLQIGVVLVFVFGLALVGSVAGAFYQP